MTDLETLIERLEAATGPDRELDTAICVALQLAGENSDGATDVRPDPEDEGWLIFEIDGEECCNKVPAYTASLDAAMTLDAPDLKQFGGAMAMLREAMDRMFTAKAPDSALPRFLCAAFLRARAAIAQGVTR